MKDVTSTTFGLLIAYLLPGLAGLYGLTFWFPAVRRLFDIFLTLQSNVGLFLLVAGAGLGIGLQVSALRWLLFERWVCKKEKLPPADFAMLAAEGKLVAFRAAVDEYYRYHQFWGGMCLVAPPAYIGLLRSAWAGVGSLAVAFSFLAVIALEVVNFHAAVVTYRSFVASASRILRGT